MWRRQERQRPSDGADFRAEVVLGQSLHVQNRIAQTWKSKLKKNPPLRVGVSGRRAAGVKPGGTPEKAGPGITVVAGATEHDGMRDAPFEVRQRPETHNFPVEPWARERFNLASPELDCWGSARVQPSEENLQSK